MFEINRGIVCNIISKAQQINIADDLTFPEDRDDFTETEWRQVLAEYQEDLSYLELKDLIKDLEPDQQQKIIALMYIGRGDYKESEWPAALEQALTVPIEARPDYLISKSMLSDYLSEGLAIFGFSCEDE